MSGGEADWESGGSGVAALMFDVGGVLLEINFDRAFQYWADCSGQPVDEIRRLFESLDAFVEYELGTISEPEFVDALRAAVKLELRDHEILQGWDDIYVGLAPGIEVLLDRVAASYPLFILSNCNARHREAWVERFPVILRHMDDVFVSCDLALRKPDPAVYEEAASRAGYDIGQILFFDDSDVNVRGARHAGMMAVRVASPHDIESIVGRLRPASKDTDV